MLTGIGRIEMRVLDLDACRAFYRDAMGLTEFGASGDRDGARSSTFVVGESVLECIEDPDAVVGRLPTGEERDWVDVPGSVNHFALYVDDIYAAYGQLKGKAEPRTLKDGPEAMPLGHTYLQRSLLDFVDPSGFAVQIAEVIEPGEEMQRRKAAKQGLASEPSDSGMMRGFDHFSIYVRDPAATRSFYVEKLGMEEYGQRDVEGTDQWVLMVGLTDLEFNLSEAYKDKQLGAGIVSMFGFWTDDLQQAHSLLAAKGVAPGDIATRDAGLPYAVRSFSCVDPDGLPIEISERA